MKRNNNNNPTKIHSFIRIKKATGVQGLYLNKRGKQIRLELHITRKQNGWRKIRDKINKEQCSPY